MAMIKDIKKATVKVSEQTIKELLGIVTKDKEHNDEIIIVESEYAPVIFEISIELKPHTMESLGYRLRPKIKHMIKPLITKGKDS